MFYINLTMVILAKMKHHFRRHSAVRQSNVQTLGRQEFDSNVLKCAVPPACIARSETRACTWRWGRAERSYATDGAVAQELRRYHVKVH